MAKKNSGRKGSRSKSPRGNRSSRGSREPFSNPQSTVSTLTRNPAEVMENDVATNKMAHYSPMTMFVMIILYSIAIAINYMALMWLLKLDEINCECSKSWMHTYIKYFLYVYFVIIAISIVINLYLFLSETSPEQSQAYKMFAYVLMVFGFFGIANVIISLVYIDMLKRMDCKCSEDVKREIYWYYNIVTVALWAFVFLLGIISAIIFGAAFARA
jgi:hypothetical protein